MTPSPISITSGVPLPTFSGGWWPFGHKPLWQSVSCCEGLPFSCNSVPVVMSLSLVSPQTPRIPYNSQSASYHPQGNNYSDFFPHWRLVLPLLEFHINVTTECVRVSVKAYCIRSHVLSSQVSGSHGSHSKWRFWLIYVSWVWIL